MYVDIWDIEIITHAAKREREREREKPGLQRAWDTRNRALSCRCSRVRTHRGEGRLSSLFLPVYLRIVHATHARVYKLVVRSRMLAPG